MSTIKAQKIQPPGDSDPLQIFTNTVERMRVTSGGLVGIGTATPTLTLQVVGSICAVGGAVDYPAQVSSNAIFVGGAGTPDSGRIIIGDSTGWKYKISNRIGSVTTDLVTFDDRGMVGVGISPESSLHVVGAQNYGSAANSGIVTIGNANNSRQINLGVSDTNSVVYIEGWVPGVGGSHLALQPSGGRVGIGVAAPAVALDVAGEARSSISTTAGSNAKTLTTKDYMDTSRAFGSITLLGSLAHTNNGTIFTTSSVFFIAQDSFLIVRALGSGSSAYQSVYVDTFSPPTTLRFTNSAVGSGVITCPIAKNSYVKVTQSSANNQTTTISLMPIGS